jgi:hypothetical protein
MATKKKVSVKKKPVANKRKPAAKKKVIALAGLIGPSPKYKSFKLGKDGNFFKMRITKQTIYWSILLAVILFVQIVVLTTQLNVLEILDILSRR